MKSLILVTLINLIPVSVLADDHNFKSWNDKQFENYPFECVEDGVTGDSHLRSVFVVSLLMSVHAFACFEKKTSPKQFKNTRHV